MRALAFAAMVGTSLAACGGSNPPSHTGGSIAAAPAASSVEAAATASDPIATSELVAGIKAFDTGNYAEARKSFDVATKKNPSDYQASYNLGLACEKLGDKPAAEAAYKAALTLKPDLEAAAVALTALYFDEGRLDEVLATGRAALGRHPANAALHENVGIALATRGDQENATRELEDAIKAQPSEPMFHLTLAHWLNTWHVRGAGAQLDAARDLTKDDYGMIASVGHEYRMAGDFDSCIKTFERAIQIRDGGEVRTERALCKLGVKDEKGMIDDLQAAVAKEPSYAPGHYYLGGRLLIAKRFKEAAAEYAKYLELAPAGSLSRQASERMKAAQEAAKTGSAVQKKK